MFKLINLRACPDQIWSVYSIIEQIMTGFKYFYLNFTLPYQILDLDTDMCTFSCLVTILCLPTKWVIKIANIKTLVEKNKWSFQCLHFKGIFLDMASVACFN